MTDRTLTAVQTSGGMGTRARPINLYSESSMIPKGLIRVMGTPIAELQIRQFVEAEINDLYVVTQHLENREHLSNRFGDGRNFGLDIHYSDPQDDWTNNGSGDAILSNIQSRNLTGDSIILPNDNLFEFDLSRIIQQHRKTDAVISVLTIDMQPIDTLDTYGLINADDSNKVVELAEKPESIEDLVLALRLDSAKDLSKKKVPVNTAGYITDNDSLMQILSEDWVRNGRESESGFDMAGDLITGLLKHGHPVNVTPIDSWGDFGSTDYILSTIQQALAGNFPSVHGSLGKNYYHDPIKNIWIHKETLKREYRGKTLQERMKSGDVNIGSNTFIGRRVIIEDGAEIRYSNIEKYVKVGKGVQIDHSYLLPNSIIGPYAEISHSALGLQIKVNSSEETPTRIKAGSAIGPKITIPEGTALIGVSVYPGFNFEGSGEYSHTDLTPSKEHVMRAAIVYGPPK
ncbi:NDP-sugar synthase [Candidatus Woesearchaeota archaeon]|nr:NDP-sugar synthase [Candidatus Woesearchaeota archaeon]